MKTVKSAVTVSIFLAGQLSGQAYFTLPKNVWRISVVREAASANWVSAGGKKGLPDEYFTLDGYGLKYYDELNLDSLISLNEHLVNTDDRVDDIVQTFNDLSEDKGWEIQLYDFNRSFFNRDSLSVGGFITNTKRSLQSQLTKIRFEYGITERVTSVSYTHLTLPTNREV